MRPRRRVPSDLLFDRGTLALGLIPVAIIAAIAVGLFTQSALSRHHFGWSIITTSTWDVVHARYGAVPYIFGTLVSSLVALIIAVPIAVGAAVFLAENAPRWLATPVSFLIELLAAVPSVILGLWGFNALCPWMQDHSNPWLADHFGRFPLFAGPPYLTTMLAAGVILAIMVLPLITAVTQDVMRTVPPSQRDGSYALGATRWETIVAVVLHASRPGIIGAVMLAFGRAVGETMAVVMVIGNTPDVSLSLLHPGYTMPGLLANEFNEAFTNPMQRSALVEVALILFCTTLGINVLARLLILLTVRTHAPAGPALMNDRARDLTVKCSVAALGGIVILAAAHRFGTDLREHPAALLGQCSVLVIGALAMAGLRRAWSLRRTPALRHATDRAAITMTGLCASTACVALGLILGYVLVQSAGSLSLSFFTQLPKPPDDPTGGMKNGILGTLILVGLAALFGIPVGLGGGIYLAEHGASRHGGVLRFSADVLNGVPSVVIGMFAYTAFVLPFKQFSAWSGGAALGMMVAPMVIRTTEEMLRLVPPALRDAAIALGSTRWQAMRHVLLPAARAGIVTGMMLAIARVAGETAPLLFTAFGNDQLSASLGQPISSLTLLIYRNATAAYPTWVAQAWAGALVLLVLVLLLSTLARVSTSRGFRIV